MVDEAVEDEWVGKQPTIAPVASGLWKSLFNVMRYERLYKSYGGIYQNLL